MKNNRAFIEVIPSEIVLFDDVPRKPSVCFVTLRNITAHRVAYKIKTTSPKDYVVKPNNGIISPHEEKRIEFTMQPTDFVPSSKNTQDKFMIMAIEIDQSFDVSKISEAWKDLPQNQVQQAKLIAGFKGSNLTQSVSIAERRFGNSLSGQKEMYEDRNNMAAEKVRMSMPVGVGRTSNQMYQSTASPERYSVGTRGQREDSDQLLTKVREQEKQIVRLTEERNQFFDELTSLKENVERNKLVNKGSNKGNYSSFQLWHILLVAIVSLIIGAFLSA